MRYCPDCGTPHECEAQGTSEKAEVAIERLRTQRDIEVARITAAAGVKVAETEAEHAADFAEGRADGMETVIEAGTEPDADEGAPIVVDVPDEPEPEPEEEPESAPDVVEVTTPRETKRGGYWSNYR